MNLGPGELLIVLVIVLVLFGASRLPKLARSMGQASKEFREGLREGAVEESVGGPCPFCDTEVPTDAKFCPGCGKAAEEIVSERARSSDNP